MPCDDGEQIELQVIVDVLDAVEAKLREHERCGWRLTVARTRIYAAVLHAVILSARSTCIFPPTLDRAAVLDTILDGAEPSGPGGNTTPIDRAIEGHIVNFN